MSYRVFDIETTTKSSFKRKANPFDRANWVVAVGSIGFGEVVPTGQYFKAPHSVNWFADMLADESLKTLVGFNIKFDILHAIQNTVNYRAWQLFIARGGRIWDCQLAEYLLEGMHQAVHMPSLDEVAPRYGGELKDDEVKALWEAGVDTPDIPKDLLMRYLLGDNTGHVGDVENTKRVFLGQAKRAKEAGQMRSIMLNMGSLMYTIEAEHRGMYVDKARGLELAKELEIELAATHEELMTHLPPDLPFQFNLGSRFHMSAWLFGGEVTYEDTAYTFDDHDPVFMDDYNPEVHPPIRYTMKEELHYQLEDGTTTQAEGYSEWLTPKLMAGETVAPRSVNKSGKLVGEFKTKKVKTPDESKPKTRKEPRKYKMDGITIPDPKWKSDDGLTYSTAAEVIAVLVNRDQPFLKLFGRYSSLSKDLGTYFITGEPGKQKGMLTLVDDDGIVHHKLNHTSTVTGRFSSSDPNLQNLPKGNKSRVKEVFISRFGAEGSIIQSDFSALEVYVQAILTKCKNLISDLLEGIDMHCMRLAIKEKMSYAEVYDLCKVQELPEWDMKRTKAKVFSFQRAYGAGVKKIAESTGMAIEEVEALVAAEMERYPEIAEYYDVLSDIIEESARDVHDYAQHPDFPKVTINLRRGTYRTSGGKLYSYKEQPAPKYIVDRQGKFTSFSPTEIKNYVAQGEGAEWAKAAMYLAIRIWAGTRNFSNQSFLINQVHDACYADSHNSVLIESAAALHACMTMASAYMEKVNNEKFPVWVPSETVCGPSMAIEKHIPDPEQFKLLVAKWELHIQQNIIPTL